LDQILLIAPVLLLINPPWLTRGKYEMSGFNDLLRICREAEGLSLREAAKKLKVSPTTLCKLENRELCNIRVRILIDVCHLYGINMEPILYLIEMHNEKGEIR